jgi:putative radical SAM enzyme (TIGR03279 family)
VKYLNYSAIITNVHQDSIGEELGLVPGDKLLAVNGESSKDLIELSFALSEENLELLIEKVNGTQEIIELEKDYDDELGLEFESAVFDGVRRCANNCVFCFVDQMAPNMRESLYVKDDDYRLSFLYGNFVTLTNSTPKDMKRIYREHLSPLYVSVHTTNAELRERMLGNKFAGKINEQLKDLIRHDIEVHIQIVLCPGINDGKELEKTIADLYALGSNVLSVAIVPVGLTRFRNGLSALNGFTAAEAKNVIQAVEGWQKKFRSESGSSFVYLADEFYLAADYPIPKYDFYDGFPQLENGIGIVRSFMEEWREAAKDSKPKAYQEPYRLDVVCGLSAEKVLKPLINELSASNLNVRIIPIENKFFGSQITVTGLLTGQDIIDKAQSLQGPRTGLIVPGVALRKGEDVFLDDMSLGKMEKAMNIPVRAAYSATELYDLLLNWDK